MFDLKTRKRDFEHQLFFLLEKSQTSGRKSKFQEIERRKVARPRDRRAQNLGSVFVFRDRSADAVGTISVVFHHHRSTPRNRRTSTFFFFSQNAFDTKTKRKEKKCASSEVRVHFCLPRSFRRRRRNDLRKLKEGFFPSSLDFENAQNAPSFHAALPREKRKTRHAKRKEKTRTLKNTPPFQRCHSTTQPKRWKNFSSAPSFYAKTGDGSLADVRSRSS